MDGRLFDIQVDHEEQLLWQIQKFRPNLQRQDREFVRDASRCQHGHHKTPCSRVGQTKTFRGIGFNMFRFCTVLVLLFASSFLAAADDDYSVRQITFGPAHHLFGYIGHGKTIPWNASGRYILALRCDFDDQMPTLDDPADILLLDTENDFQARKVAETRGWNFQQGTMFYWNPDAAESQFFFNDRDRNDGTLFTVLFDIASGKRLREYRFPDSPVANSGVAPAGGYFLALNYGRLARLRLVTGYAGLVDWSRAEKAPDNDGVFKVNVETGQRELVVSYRQLREAIRDQFDEVDDYDLFVNHTLWNRPSDRFYFYVRANFRSPLQKVDVPFTANADGTGLARHKYMGGHPEWDAGNVMALSSDGRQVRYDTTKQEIVGTIGKPDTFSDPGGDVAFSPDGKWFANGDKRRDKTTRRGETVFTFLNQETGRVFRTEPFPVGRFTSGELRIDPAPDWNRTSDQILFGAYDPKSKTRQLFVLTIRD